MFTASASDLGISAWQVRDAGNLTARFDGVTALTTTTHLGQTWVFAGWADDGITAFQMLDGGRLVAHAHIADTVNMTLANVSALAARSNGGNIDIFAASASDAGLTRLSLNIDTNDLVIMDTAGSDMLTGGVGADVFVMAADGQIDTITDFTLGEDRLDLSNWNGLRRINQLFFDPISGGVQITYGDEVLILRSADGLSIAPSAL